MRMTMRSEITRVPPVTPERSPPASRMTGADSPVMADSSTLATPSTTSPSPGMRSPASQTTRSPERSSEDCTSFVLPPPLRRCAVIALRIERSESALALPWASAMPSAKLAKRRVNQSQAITWTVKELGGRPPIHWAAAMIVHRREPAHTMNITGFLISTRGSSLAKAGARRGEDGLLRDAVSRQFFLFHSVTPIVMRKWSRIGPRVRAGKCVSPATITTTERRRTPKVLVSVLKVPAPGATSFLAARLPATPSMGNMTPKRPMSMSAADREVIEGRIDREAAEGRAVVARARRVGVEDLGEAVRPAVREAGQADRQGYRDRAEGEDEEVGRYDREHRELDLPRLDLLAEVLGASAHHEPRDEDRYQDEGEHAVEARAHAAEDHLAEHDVDHGDHPAQGARRSRASSSRRRRT